MQQHARMPRNSSTEPFPPLMNPERNFGLLCAKAAIERVGEWGGAETTHFVVYEDIKSTFLGKIVTESIGVDISH